MNNNTNGENEKDMAEGQNKNVLASYGFIKDTHLSFIFKKSEKIVTAVYMITNFFDRDEPLKWELRKTCSKLLKVIMSFNNTSLSNREAVTANISNEILELNSFFDIAYRSGFVSVMNYQIINSEINNLANYVYEYSQGQMSPGKTLFNKSFFDIDRPKQALAVSPSVAPFVQNSENKIGEYGDLDKGQSKGQHKGQDVSYKTNASGTLPGETENPQKMALVQSDSYIHKERQGEIIKIIKKTGEASIKDIVDQMKGVSEKTVQRELQKMLDLNVLYKTGDRRWTKYFIK